jgi:hypothetical protein
MNKTKHKLSSNTTGFYGDWTGSYICGEHHVKIVQCGDILRCVQMSPCPGVPFGVLRWQLNLNNMAGLAMVNCPMSCPCQCVMQPVAMRVSVISHDKIAVCCLGGQRIVFTREPASGETC